MMKKIRKSLSLLLAAALTASALLAGCGGTGASSAPATSDVPAQASVSAAAEPAAKEETQEPVTIRVLTRYTGTDATTPVFQEMIRTFMEKYPYITVQDDSVNEEAAYMNKLMTGVATGDVPNIFYLTGLMGGVEWAKNGVIMDISELMQDESWYEGFTPSAFEPWNFGSFGTEGYYGVPFSVGVEAFYYNKDIFKEAGIEKVPETLDEFYQVVDKLKAINVVPLAVGAKETWRAGHILNWLTYKNVGIEKVKQIGARTAKWTDQDMVDTLKLYMDMRARGTFPGNYEGVTYDEEKNMFFSGKAAMVLNGSWFVGDCITSPIADKIGVFNTPYITGKEQFKGDGIIYPQGFCLSAKATGAEREAQILFIKHMTSLEMQTKMVESVQRMSPRADIPLATMDVSPIFNEISKIAGEIEKSCGDTFDYDPLVSMVDRTRNSLVGMSLGMSPEDAAAEIQAEIDKNS